MPNLVINTQVGSQNSPAALSEDTSTLYTANQTITQTLLLNASGSAGSQYASPVGFSQITINPGGPVTLTAQKGTNAAYISQTVNQLTIIDDTVDSFQITNTGTAQVAVSIVWIVKVSNTTPIPGIVTSVNGVSGAVVLSATSIPGLAVVAQTGNYYDLINRPLLAVVASTGSYNDLVNRPTIPQAPVNADWNATSGLAQILNQPTLAPVATAGTYASLTGRPTFAVVAISGSYDDLSDRPALAAVATSGSYADLTDRPALAAVAISGSYSDLINTPAPYTLPASSSTILGGVRISSTSGLVVDGSGNLSLGIATASQLGGIKSGSGLIIGPDGTLTAAVQTVAGRTGDIVLAVTDVTDAASSSGLAASGGAGLIGYGSETVAQALDAISNNTDPTQGAALVGYKSTLTGAVGRTVASKFSDNVSLLEFADAAGAWKTDSTAMYNAAINAINAIVTAQNESYPVPAIEIPSGIYPITNTLSLYPWHRFVSRGSVVLDFTNLPVTLNGIEVRNEQTTIPLGDMLFATRSPVLDGSNGSICLRGPGKTVSTGFGIAMGNRTSASQPVRDTGGRDLIITGWGGALHYDPVNLYLITWEGCRFEQNLNQCIHTTLPSGFTQVLNSGERMTFIDCTFAASHNVLYHNCDGFDYQFVGCSMDYNDAPFYFDTAGRYTNVKIIGGHIEAFDSYIFDGTVAGQYIEIMISNWDVLPTHRTSTTAIASPTRTFFAGNPANRMRLSINGMVVYYLHPPYLPDTPMADDNVFVLALNGMIFRSYYPMTTRSRSLGRDYAFTANAVGTAGNALTYWVRDTGGTTFVDILSNTIVTDPSTSALGNTNHLLGGGTDAAATFHTVETFPCKPGDVFYPQADAYAPTVTTGTIGIRVFQRFYDEAGVAVTPTSDFGTTYSLATAFTDTTLPNYSSGQNRWMAINGAVNVAPIFAASYRIYFTVTSFTGDLYIKNVRVIPG